MHTHCVDCGASIYDSQIDLCDDCEHKYESKPQYDWRYQMHREMAERDRKLSENKSNLV